MLTFVADGESVGAGARGQERMSVQIGSEHARGVRVERRDDVHAVTDRYRDVRITPGGRPRPHRGHRLAVEHNRRDVRVLGDDRHRVGEIVTQLQYVHEHEASPAQVTELFRGNDQNRTHTHVTHTESTLFLQLKLQSELEVNFNLMRYMHSRFSYLLTLNSEFLWFL